MQAEVGDLHDLARHADGRIESLQRSIGSMRKLQRIVPRIGAYEVLEAIVTRIPGSSNAYSGSISSG